MTGIAERHHAATAEEIHGLVKIATMLLSENDMSKRNSYRSSDFVRCHLLWSRSVDATISLAAQVPDRSASSHVARIWWGHQVFCFLAHLTPPFQILQMSAILAPV